MRDLANQIDEQLRSLGGKVKEYRAQAGRLRQLKAMSTGILEWMFFQGIGS